MGESSINGLKAENQMKEPAISDTTLQVSVSFGRFEKDSLSWERWSSFSPNKYLEEVEKCSTPGSVAMKKAYFEAHYKKIAARNAEVLEQERVDADSLRSDEPCHGELLGNGCENNKQFDQTKGERIAEAGELDTKSVTMVSRTDDSEASETEDSAITIECQASFNEGFKEELTSRTDISKSKNPEVCYLINEEELQEELISRQGNFKSDEPDVAALFTEEVHSIGSQALMELQLKADTGTNNTTQENKVDKVEEKQPKESQKIISATKQKTLVKERKPSLTSKSLQNSTHKTLKSEPTLSGVPASLASTSKGSSSSLPRTKNSAVGSKKPTSTSLHMSHKVESMNSDLAPPTTRRRSFIMENMGDKEIVKRAFKAFQNSYNHLGPSSETNSSFHHQVSMKRTAQNASASVTPQHDKERSFKAANVNQRSAKAAPYSSFRTSEERTEKQREFFKKLEGKTSAKGMERLQLQSNSKLMQVKKKAEIKTARKNLDFKAVPTPDLNGAKGRSKSRVNKEGDKSEIRHQAEMAGDRRRERGTTIRERQ